MDAQQLALTTVCLPVLLQCNAETSQCDFIPLEPCLSTCTVSGVSGTCSATNQTGPLLSCVLPLDGQGCSAGEHCPLKWCCVAQDKRECPLPALVGAVACTLSQPPRRRSTDRQDGCLSTTMAGAAAAHADASCRCPPC
jgi:hypothetical protein